MVAAEAKARLQAGVDGRQRHSSDAVVPGGNTEQGDAGAGGHLDIQAGPLVRMGKPDQDRRGADAAPDEQVSAVAVDLAVEGDGDGVGLAGDIGVTTQPRLAQQEFDDQTGHRHGQQENNHKVVVVHFSELEHLLETDIHHIAELGRTRRHLADVIKIEVESVLARGG